MNALKKTIGEGTLWFSVSTLGVKFLGLANVFIILRTLSVYEYGQAELVLSIVPLLGFFLLPGLNAVVTADIAVEKGRENLAAAKGMFINFAFLQAALAVCAWAVVFFGAGVLSKFYTEGTADLFRAVSFLFLLSPLRVLVGILLDVHARFRTQSLYGFLEEGAKLIFIILFLFYFGFGVIGIILAAVLSQAVALIVTLPDARRFLAPFRGVQSFRYPFLFFIRGHGKWNVFSSYLGQFGAKMRLWIIKFLLGTEAVGLYAVAEGFVGHTVSLLPLSRVLTPIIPQAVGDRERFLRIVTKAIKYQVLSFSALMIVAMVAFPPVLVLIFPAYSPSMTLFQIMLLTLLPVAVTGIFRPVFFAFKAQLSLFRAVLAKTLLSLILAPTLIIWFGLTGVAVEFVLTALWFFLERYRVMRVLLPEFSLRIRDFVRVDEFDRMVISAMMSRLRSLFSPQ